MRTWDQLTTRQQQVMLRMSRDGEVQTDYDAVAYVNLVKFGLAERCNRRPAKYRLTESGKVLADEAKRLCLPVKEDREMKRKRIERLYQEAMIELK